MSNRIPDGTPSTDNALERGGVDTECSIFLIPATAQFTFKHYNPKTKEITWKSINASNFKANGRACKSDELVSQLSILPPVQADILSYLGNPTHW